MHQRRKTASFKARINRFRARSMKTSKEKGSFNTDNSPEIALKNKSQRTDLDNTIFMPPESVVGEYLNIVCSLIIYFFCLFSFFSLTINFLII